MENVWLQTPTGYYISGSAFTIATSFQQVDEQYVYQLFDSAQNLVYQSVEEYPTALAALQAFGAILQAAGITGFKVVDLT